MIQKGFRPAEILDLFGSFSGSNMLASYFPILILLFLSALMAAALPIVSYYLGPRRPTEAKQSTYECGCTIIDTPRKRTSIRYYIIAILFILFDIEAAFLYPWALVLRKLPLFFFLEMAVFALILLAGYAYLWKKGALEWE